MALRDVLDADSTAGRCIQDERVADDTFRKSVFSEAVDLLIEPFAEVARDASRLEAIHQAVLVLLQRSVLAPGGHVATQAIGLSAAVTRADDRDLHDLLLEERDTEGAFEDRREDG